MHLDISLIRDFETLDKRPHIRPRRRRGRDRGTCRRSDQLNPGAQKRLTGGQTQAPG